MAATSRVRIGIVDDHFVFRRSMRLMLEREADFCVAAEAENGVGAMRMLEAHELDVVLMDVRMPLMDGLEATRIITAKYPQIKVVIISLLEDDNTRRQASEAGASIFLPKGCKVERLFAAIRDDHSKGLQTVDLHRSSNSSKKTIIDLIRSIAYEPNQVAVKAIPGHPLAFELQVALLDYDLVVSKLPAIVALAGSFAGLSKEEQLLIHVKPV